MRRNLYCSTALVLVLSVPFQASAASSESADLDIPSQSLASALQALSVQSDSQVLFSNDAVAGRRAPPLKGQFSPKDALAILVRGTGLHVEQNTDRVFLIRAPEPVRVAVTVRQPAAGIGAGIETVVVTAEKKSEDIQSVPIAVSAFTQKDLKERQVATGGDLIREVPNMNFGKTNFSGYSIELRGIGTQAISVTTDPAVAVAFNGTPFIRNHFFEQEFFDLGDVEVLRGPQGTLYGRNATAGVVNLASAKPTDEPEVTASADFGNFNNRRLEGMINIPIVGDRLDIRVAGEWTKRDGYTEDTTLNKSIDGRDLWSGRVSIGFKPTEDLQTYLIWEHFSESDDRLRSGKQLCETAPPATSVNGVSVPPPGSDAGTGYGGGALSLDQNYTSQSCQLTSLYAPTAFQVPYGPSLPYIIALNAAGSSTAVQDPYSLTTQSRNLRDIQSQILPSYKAKNDIVELNSTYTVNPTLTLTSQTGFSQDFLWSTEDYNRFDTAPGIFTVPTTVGTVSANEFFPDPNAGKNGIPAGATIFCDPQLGCSDRILAEDLNNEKAWQLNQEFRVASNFEGPLNFSVGGSYLHYETEENYYVFINALSIYADVNDHFGNGNLPDHSDCIQDLSGGNRFIGGWQNLNPFVGGGQPTQSCIFIDTNPIGHLNNKGHNYFLSQNPYTLNSYAGFGEIYYNILPDLKFTGGLRYTIDQKHFTDIPSEVVDQGLGYPVTGVVNQEWDRITGRAVLNWTPKIDFTDQSMFYASYAHGYKAGGANPPGAIFAQFGAGSVPSVAHPLTFKPEYIEAFELGTKNSLLDGTLTLNADIFYYNYHGYQISEIVDRTAINNNYNAHVEGAELESTWEPSPGLRFNFAGGWEDTGVAGGQTGIDLMDRTAGMPGWMVIKPFATQASNCILPTYVVAALLQEQANFLLGQQPGVGPFACGVSYSDHLDPVTGRPYVANPTGISTIPPGEVGTAVPIPAGYPGFNPLQPGINNGEGFAKSLAGHKLPNAPPYTVSFGTQYTFPVWTDWAATLRGDFYWQGNSFARIFNDKPYDQLHGYTNLNLALILNSSNGWQVMGYVKNVFNTTAITGDFLNSDDSGLTTNVFLTDPRLFGVRVTKDFAAGEGNGGDGVPEFLSDIFSVTDGKRPELWIELGGQAENLTGYGDVFTPAFLAVYPKSSVLHGPSPVHAQRLPAFGFGEEARVSFAPHDSDWILSAAVRIGRSGGSSEVDHQTNKAFCTKYLSGHSACDSSSGAGLELRGIDKFSDTVTTRRESHTILDFTVGKDLGLGMFSLDGSSVISGGLRFAQFSSKLSLALRARPEINFAYLPSSAANGQCLKVPVCLDLPVFHTYHVTGQAKRNFHGIGPTISWSGSTPLDGDLQNGELTFDWGANGALLFGRQRAHVAHHESAHYITEFFIFRGQYYTAYNRGGGHDSARNVVVPNLGGLASVSYRLNNAKVSLGYRADFFFGAIDGGIDRRKSQTLGFTGPFANISIGLGG